MVWCRLVAVSFENVGHGGIRDVVTDVRKCSLNLIAAPSWILFREPNNEIHYALTDALPSHSPPFVAVIPFLRYEIPMPNRIVKLSQL